ncbi:uncharacterized [Tachysurus ichikawai]
MDILDNSCGKHVCYTGSLPCVDAYLRPGCLQRDIIHMPDIITDDEVDSTTRLFSVEMYKLTRLQMATRSRWAVCWKPDERILLFLRRRGWICKE